MALSSDAIIKMILLGLTELRQMIPAVGEPTEIDTIGDLAAAEGETLEEYLETLRGGQT